jgi:TetR/AcrR family transcriptional regulator, transcriptional repressor of bet genes
MTVAKKAVAAKAVAKHVAKTIAPAPERASRVRQRQRLIDACISALHIHGPSRTTVEKVVALADMSPGIVRFYFDSKDAMLLASLAYLAAEFEERVMVPVAQLRETPVVALERLVDLYLDPDIASPRKVSVWYSFWGEASSRQEYYDICGRKDEDFAALVRDLVARVVAMTGDAHLDTDGIALGLMGALEVLWQGIAFQNEADIDREAARKQSMGFLRSVFPGAFGVVRLGSGAGGGAGAGAASVDAASVGGHMGSPGAGAGGSVASGGGGGGTIGSFAVGASHAIGSRAMGVSDLPRHLPRWVYSDAVLLTAERERLFRVAWQVVGHAVEIPAVGDFLTGDLGGERALVVRDEKGVLRAFRNACRRRPHALVTARTGHFSGVIPCVPHGLSYGFDGKLLRNGADGGLTPLEIKEKSGVVLVRASGATREGGPALTGWEGFANLVPVGEREFDVAADWKLIVEQWLEGAPAARGRYLAPNQLVEAWDRGAAVLRVVPVVPGRSRLVRLDYGVAVAKDRASGGKRSGQGAKRGARGGEVEARHGKPDARGDTRGAQGDEVSRRLETWIAQQIELAESTQTGLAASGEDFAENGPVSAALAEFRGSIAVLLPHLGAESPKLAT